MSVEFSSEPPAESGRTSFAGRLRGFGPVGIVALLLVVAGALVFMPIAAGLILVWALASKTPMREIGFGRPRSWIGALVVGLVLGVALKVAMKAVVLPLLGAPAVAHNAIHDSVMTQAGALSLAAYAVYGAGFAEELVFRGYLFERLGRLMGRGAFATLIALVITTALFGAAHWGQGLFGMANAAATGCVFGVLYLITGRRLWVPMVAHAAFDLTAVVMIYWNLEPEVARLVF